MPLSPRALAVTCVLLASCASDLLALGDPDPLREECATTAFRLRYVGQRQVGIVDLLVVVDNTMSMAEEQANLARNFPELIRELLVPPDWDGDTRPDRLPVESIHIGVISTDMGTAGYLVYTCPDSIDGDDGILLDEPNPSIEGCDRRYPSFLSYESTDPDEEAADKLAQDFECIATLGQDGCNIEQQLKAALKALTVHRDGANAGFLREDSFLVILFLTDEEDCSVAPGYEELYDTTRSDLGPNSLRCFHHPYMLEPVETYVDAFQELRDDPDKLLVAFITGVPQSAACEGFGDEIPTCLEHPDMIEQVDPVRMTRLLPSCTSSTGEAYPARRLVEVAQGLGDSAYVQSICTDDFRPALQGLVDRLHVVIDVYIEPLPVSQDPEDPCRCESPCQLIEMLSNDRPCPPGKPCIRSASGACRVDWDGESFHSLCEIPRLGSRMVGCEPESAPDCIYTPLELVADPAGGSGWYWDRGPYPRYTEGMKPEDGSEIYAVCNTCLGPPLLPPASGGQIGTTCSPETCPPELDDMGEPTGSCDWEWATYIAEARECRGGACLAFRVDHDESPYCSRRCGPSNEGMGCPDGYSCYPAVMHEDLVRGCWCVRWDQLNTSGGSYDLERLRECR